MNYFEAKYTLGDIQVGDFVLIMGEEDKGYGEVVEIKRGKNPEYPIIIDWDKESEDHELGGEFEVEQVLDIK